MQHFDFGLASIIGAIIFPILYFAGFQFRSLARWTKRQPPPTDRVGFFLLAFAIVGFIVGSFAQPLVDKGFECKSAGQPVASCMFIPK